MQESSTKKIYDVHSVFYDATFGRLVRRRIERAINHMNIAEDDLVLAAHPGPSPVLLYLGNHNKTTVLRLGGGYTVEMRNGLYAELRSVGVEALA